MNPHKFADAIDQMFRPVPKRIKQWMAEDAANGIEWANDVPSPPLSPLRAEPVSRLSASRFDQLSQGGKL